MSVSLSLPSFYLSLSHFLWKESQTSFPGQQENGGDHGAVIGAIVAGSFIFCIAVAIGTVALLLVARCVYSVQPSRSQAGQSIPKHTWSCFQPSMEGEES